MLPPYNKPSLYERVEETWWNAYEQSIYEQVNLINVYRDYFEGAFTQFQSTLTDRQRQYIFQYRNLGYNLCHKAVMGPVNRLQLVNLAPLTSSDQTDAQRVWDWLTLNRVDSQQINLYINAVRDGAAYILCWPSMNLPPDERFPRTTVHTAYNGETGIQPILDLDTGNTTHYRHYFKNFLDNGQVINYRDDYWPDRIEHYYLEENGEWTLISVDPWLGPGKQPLGLAIIEFAYPFGSKLKNLIGLQDCLNKCLMDFMEWADKAIYPIKYVLGAQIAYESSTGDMQEPETGPDVMWISDRPADANAQVGQLEPPSVEGLVNIIDQFKGLFVEVGNLSPLDFLPHGKSPWTGEGLSSMEVSFLAEVQMVQTNWGNSWEDVSRMLLRIDNAFNGGNNNGNVLLDSKWRIAQVRDGSFWNNLILKQTLGWSNEQLQRDAGLTEQEIERMKGETQVQLPKIQQSRGDTEKVGT